MSVFQVEIDIIANIAASPMNIQNWRYWFYR